MWPLVILGTVALALLATWSGIIAPPHATLLLRVRPDSLIISRGRLKPYAKEYVVEILKDFGVRKGFIAMTPGNRVVFSRHIPASARQRLRNVLLNQP